MKMRMFAACAVAVAGISATFGGAGPVRERTVVVPEGWTMAQKTAPEKWLPAVVPGTVLQTLVRNGVVPDPYFGLNNQVGLKRIPDLSENRDFYTVTYRAKVTLPEAWFRDRTVWMRPEGINYRGGIRLNGRYVAGTAGTFARNPIDVSEFLHPGVNDVEVEVQPVDQPGSPIQKWWGAPGEWHNGGDGEIGRNVTILMGAGWDFMFGDGIRDRHAGIWKDLTFFSTDLVMLDAPFVRTKLNDDMTEAELTFECDLINAGYNWGQRVSGVLEAEVEGTDVKFEKRMEFFRGERRTEKLTATLRNPKLWWPRNKGPQNLYTLKARFTDTKGAVSDEVRVRFGVREFASDQSGPGGARQFYVNRRKIFIRGTNWIPDAMLKCDDARMERIFALVGDSGFNLLRQWAGGITESDRFYELCDENGLLVWQEFWMTGDTRHPDDPGLYLDNVAQQVKRIRSHASACHWVASNESTEMAGIEELVKKLTGTTSWMMQSECDGVHDGSPYVSVNPMRHYEDTGSNRGRRLYGFNPEYGAIALPCVENLRTFMPADKLWPMDVKTWNYREGGGFNGMTTTHHALVNAYGTSESIEAYCRRSEAADYLQQRAIWECWNRARSTATGVLYWYENPPIPELAVHGWDYDLVETPMFFAQRDALKPVHVQYEYLSNVVSVASDVIAAHDLDVTADVYDFDSRKVWSRTAALAVPGETCVDAFDVPFGTLGLGKPHFLRLTLREGGREIASTFYWRSGDRYVPETPEALTGPCTAGFAALDDLPRTELRLAYDGRTAVVENAGAKIAFLTRLELKGPDGKALKPSRYSDNFFALLPGEKKTVVAEHPAAAYTWRVQSWNAR